MGEKLYLQLNFIR